MALIFLLLGAGQSGEESWTEKRFSLLFPLHPPPPKWSLGLGSWPSLPMQCPPSCLHSAPSLTFSPSPAPPPPTSVWSLLSFHPVAFLLRTWNLGWKGEGYWLRGQQAWAADSYHFKMRLSPPPPPPPRFPVSEKSLLDFFFKSLQCCGRQGGEVLDGEGRPISYIWLETFL